MNPTVAILTQAAASQTWAIMMRASVRGLATLL